MIQSKKDGLLEAKKTIFDSDIIKHGERDGTVIEKGVVLNEDYLEKHFEEIGNMLSIFSAYPDIFLEESF